MAAKFLYLMMGGAVRILDVAEKVIKDGGKVPYKDVKIVILGQDLSWSSTMRMA